jgi:hypothetical protein
METNIPIKPVDPSWNKLQLTMRDLEHHKDYVQSKTGGIDYKDVVYIMGENNASKLVLVILRKHKIALYWMTAGILAWTWAMMWWGYIFWRL